ANGIVRLQFKYGARQASHHPSKRASIGNGDDSGCSRPQNSTKFIQDGYRTMNAMFDGTERDQPTISVTFKRGVLHVTCDETGFGDFKLGSVTKFSRPVYTVRPNAMLGEPPTPTSTAAPRFEDGLIISKQIQEELCEFISVTFGDLFGERF